MNTVTRSRTISYPVLGPAAKAERWAKDLKGEVHDDGEIWSACLWELRAALGRSTTEKLVIAHHFLLGRDSGFEDGANALISADKNLNKGENESIIRDVFIRRGILPNPKRKGKRAGTPFDEISQGVRKKHVATGSLAGKLRA